MFKKIVFSLVLSSACLLNSHSSRATYDEVFGPDDNGRILTSQSTLPKPDLSGEDLKGWVFRDVLCFPKSIEYWEKKAANHPNMYRVTENNHLLVYRD